MPRGLQELVDGLVARRGIHHAVVAVESGDGSFRWIGAAGEARPGGPPMGAETPFFVASVTKLYIAAGVLRLHEQGRLRIDDPVLTYLPTSLVGGLHRWRGRDRTGEVTVRHLLAHASGLPDFLEERPKGERSLAQRLLEEGDRSWELSEAVCIAREQLAPHFPPQPTGGRQRIRYSDTNYALLLLVVEAVTGRPLHLAFDELLWRPLGLRDTWHPGRADPREGALEPATLWSRERPLEIPLALRSSGDLVSTAPDMLRFLRALVGGELFDDPGTLALMQERWNRFGLPLPGAALGGPTWPIQYGLGLMRFRFRLPYVRTPTGARPTLIGHTGSTGSWLFHCPELDLLLAGTVDQLTAGALPFRFVPRFLRALGGSREYRSAPGRRGEEP